MMVSFNSLQALLEIPKDERELLKDYLTADSNRLYTALIDAMDAEADEHQKQTRAAAAELQRYPTAVWAAEKIRAMDAPIYSLGKLRNWIKSVDFPSEEQYGKRL